MTRDTCVYISNTRVCTGERKSLRVALSHAPKRAEERAFGIARRTNTRDVHHTENDRPTCLSSTLRANILRGQTLATTDRIVSSFSLSLSRSLSGPARGFSSLFRYVIRQMSERFRVGGGHSREQFGFRFRVTVHPTNFLYGAVNLLFTPAGFPIERMLSTTLSYERRFYRYFPLQFFFSFVLRQNNLFRIRTM